LVGADQYWQYRTVGGAGKHWQTAQAIVGSWAEGSSRGANQLWRTAQKVAAGSTGGHFNTLGCGTIGVEQ